MDGSIENDLLGGEGIYALQSSYEQIGTVPTTRR
jgi:hypothetical protein